MYKITFYKFQKEDMVGVESYTEHVDKDFKYSVKSKLFSAGGYSIDYYYTLEEGAEGTRYYPNTTIEPDAHEMFSEDTILYTAWKEGARGLFSIINDEIETDISDLIYNIDVIYGKNQPFPYGEVRISKQIFNSQSYWAGRIEMSTYLNESSPTTEKPPLIQGSTMFKIGAYGIKGKWEFQQVKDDNVTYTLICVNPAYRLKNQTLESLFKVGPYDQSGPYFSFPNLYGDENYNPLMHGGVLEGNSPQMWKLSNFEGSGVTIFVEIGVHSSPTVSRIEGKPSEIFKLLVKLGAGFDYADMVIDEGRTHFSSGFVFSDTYTREDMDNLKEVNLPISEGSPLEKTAIRAQGNLWDVLMSLSYLSNTEIFFYDKAYFVDYNQPTNVVNKLLLNYGNVSEEEWETEPILNAVENRDQGSLTIQTTQTIFSENYSATISVKDEGKLILKGDNLKYYYPDTPELFNGNIDKAKRNFQINAIALNILLKNYLPGNVISYRISEIKKSETVYPNLKSMNEDQSQDVGTIARVGSGYFSSYYIYSVGGWILYNFNSKPIRQEKYDIYSLVKELKDTQNDLLLTDVKLALTHISYPSCITKYTWGNPVFIDAEQAMTNVEMGVADATISGTDDTLISDKYSAMMVYGNLGVSELPEDRSGFTGMILEKNWDKELYRFVGYEEGKEQAMFDTDGRITAGGGDVTLDEDGLTVLFDGDYEGADYSAQSALKFKNIQNPNWTSASLFSGMLQVTMPGQTDPSKQNLTGLRVYNGKIGTDNKSANLMIANSQTGYGPTEIKSSFYNSNSPLFCRTTHDRNNPLLFQPIEYAIHAFNVFSGFNGNIYTVGRPTTSDANVDSGFVFNFNMHIDWGTASPDLNKFWLNSITFKTGSGSTEIVHTISFGGSHPPGADFYLMNDYEIAGVMECIGPHDIKLNYTDDFPQVLLTHPSISITVRKVGFFGAMTVSDMSNAGNMVNATINGVWCGGTLGDISNTLINRFTNDSSSSIIVQFIQGSTRYSTPSIGANTTISVEPFGGGGEYECCIYRPVPSSTYNYVDYLVELTSAYSTVGGDGSIVFLRNNGMYIFGDLDISAGDYGKMKFSSSGININNSILNLANGSVLSLPANSSIQASANSTISMDAGSILNINNGTKLNGRDFKPGLHASMFSNMEYSSISGVAKNQWHHNNSGGLMVATFTFGAGSGSRTLKLKNVTGAEIDLSSTRTNYPQIYIPNGWSYFVNHGSLGTVDVYICTLK